MKILGIITEYNPYHLGHRLHLQEAKKLIKPNLTICVMSSSFVQRGEPAMISYQKRCPAGRSPPPSYRRCQS